MNDVAVGSGELNEANLELTEALCGLFAIEQASRGDSWHRQLFRNLPDAALKAGEPEIRNGPDGLPYFAFFTPEEGEEFDPVSIRHLLPLLSENGLGAAINPKEDGSVDWVLFYGDLWNCRETGLFIPETPRFKRAADAAAAATESQVMLGAPSAELLPSYVRKIVGETMREQLGVASPGVYLMRDSTREPTMTLVFNVFREDFAEPETFNLAMNFLGWSLPRDYGLASVPKEVGVKQMFHSLL